MELKEIWVWALFLEQPGKCKYVRTGILRKIEGSFCGEKQSNIILLIHMLRLKSKSIKGSTLFGWLSDCSKNGVS